MSIAHHPILDTVVRALPLTGEPAYRDRGPHAGRLAHVLRLGLCNLMCEWCPVPQTWDRDHLHTNAPMVGVPQLVDAVARMVATDPQLPLLITGGEPLLQDYALLDLLSRLTTTSATTIHVETNGTIPPPVWWTSHVDHTTVSPKVGTRDPHRKRIVDRALTAWADLTTTWPGHADWAFTAATPSDVTHAAALCNTYDVRPADVTLTPLRLTRAIHDAARTHGFTLTPRITLEDQ